MGFRYQKRINLGKGVGLNVSQSGISSSYRTKHGSIGTRGFSIKTGIPGLSYRANWAKGKNGFIIVLVIMASVFIYLVIYNVVAFIFYLLSGMYQFIRRRWLNKPI